MIFLSQFGSFVAHGPMGQKHLPSGRTSGIKDGNIISSSARSSTARFNGISKRACAGGNPGGFSTVGRAAARLNVDDDEEMDVARTLSPQTNGYLHIQAPSAQKIWEHQITHLPCRSWCPHCVRSTGPTDPHRRTAELPGAKMIATVSSDCLFMGSQGLSFADPSTEQDTLPILGVYDHQTRVTIAHVCRHKGEEKHVIQDLAADLESLGSQRLLLKKRRGTCHRGTGAEQWFASWRALR